MTKDIQNITEEKYEAAKEIVQESNSQITDYRLDHGWFMICSESSDGTTVLLDFIAIETALLKDINTQCKVCVDDELIFKTHKTNIGLLAFEETIQGLDVNNGGDLI